MFISYFLAGLVSLIGILNVIELSTAMPKAGGDYYFVTRSMGPLVGTVSGVLSWLALVMKSAFAIFGMSEVLHVFFPEIPVWSSSVAFTLLFVLCNLMGVKAAAYLENSHGDRPAGQRSDFFVVGGLPQINLGAFKPMLLPGKRRH